MSPPPETTTYLSEVHRALSTRIRRAHKLVRGDPSGVSEVLKNKKEVEVGGVTSSTSSREVRGGLNAALDSGGLSPPVALSTSASHLVTFVNALYQDHTHTHTLTHTHTGI